MRSWDGWLRGRLHSFWTARRTAVLRPEKEKSREWEPSGFLRMGWGRGYLWGSPDLAVLEMAGPPG